MSGFNMWKIIRLYENYLKHLADSLLFIYPSLKRQEDYPNILYVFFLICMIALQTKIRNSQALHLSCIRVFYASFFWNASKLNSRCHVYCNEGVNSWFAKYKSAAKIRLYVNEADRLNDKLCKFCNSIFLKNNNWRQP